MNIKILEIYIIIHPMPPKKAKKPEGTKMGKIVFKARLSA